MATDALLCTAVALRTASSLLQSPSLPRTAKNSAETTPLSRMQPIESKEASLPARVVPSKRPLSLTTDQQRQSSRNNRPSSPEPEDIDDTSSQEFQNDENRPPQQSTSKLPPQLSPNRASRSPYSPSKRPRKSTDSGFAETSELVKSRAVAAVSDSEDEGAGLLGRGLLEEGQQRMELDEDRGTETQMEQESMAVSHGSPQRPEPQPHRSGSLAGVGSAGPARQHNDNSDNIEDVSLDLSLVFESILTRSMYSGRWRS